MLRTPLHHTLPVLALLTSFASAPTASADDLARAAMREARAEARRWQGELGSTQLLRADLDRRGDTTSSAGDELLLLFTIEGPHAGNSWVQLLVVMGRGADGAPWLRATRRVGGKEQLDVSRMLRVVDGELELRVRRWRPADSACCPSGRARTVRCRPLEEGSCSIDALSR
ncbi:MAG: hypothetical protein KF901_19925 [Myxococcales bacterium]|nr:hypothetical protein [Myxococcales bacterium]